MGSPASCLLPGIWLSVTDRSGTGPSSGYIGCGEGRFCRMMEEIGIRIIGIDLAESLIEHARERDPDGDYSIGD
jgi:SAM-dependent methyltransferase